MLPNVAIPRRLPGSPSARPGETTEVSFDVDAWESSLSRRRAELAAEARRLARRRSIAEVVARRSRENDRNLAADASARIFTRARRRATRLSLIFHRAIESLWEAGGFEEALTIFREHKTDLAQRGPHFSRYRSSMP
jgi:hypothetical protein